MKNYSFVTNSPKYPRKDFDLESNTFRKSKKPKNPLLNPIKMLKSLTKSTHCYCKSHPFLAFFFSLSFGTSILIFFTVYESKIRVLGVNNHRNYDVGFDNYNKNEVGSDFKEYPFNNLKNLVMVAGHSVYTSSRCERVEREESWYLEPYQKSPGQAATFVSHIEKGVEVADSDDVALLLFSGGETRRDAGPRSEAQSYWTVAESRGWFGKQESVRWRALTEEHARDSFENLLFSVCRFRELTGAYPHNITVVSYDFKEERFAHLHRSAIRFPEKRFSYSGTPASPTSKESAKKGEAMARAQFQADPYGCLGQLRRKKLGRDPFHRSIPYPNGCPEIRGLFRYCGVDPYSGSLPWA